jgi:hypothetical protein
MGASLVFTSNVFAHNIVLAEAREKAREYARSIRDDPGRNYIHYRTNCVAAFPGHNHYVRCTLFFQNAKDRERGEWTCKENIEVYNKAHGKTFGGLVDRFGDPTMYIRRTSQRAC